MNVKETKKHLYDHLLYDSEVEKNFSESLDIAAEVAVYVKLPHGFKIPTPLGNYNPDWAIAFNQLDGIKHIYFVAETKGSMSTYQLKGVENAKITCARKHFKAISSDKVKYDVVDNYSALLQKIRE